MKSWCFFSLGAPAGGLLEFRPVLLCAVLFPWHSLWIGLSEGEWVRTAVPCRLGVKPWPCSSNPLVKVWCSLLVFSCISSVLYFSETSNTWISKSFFSHQPYLFPDHFSSFLDPLPFISCIPFICPIPVLNLTDVVPDFLPTLFFFTLCFQLIFPTSSLPFLLLLCPHHCSSLWLWAAPAILFNINRAETRSAALQPAITYRTSPFSSSLRWQTLPFVYSHNSASPWTNSSEFCFKWDFPGGAGKCLWSCVSMNRCLFIQAHTVL